MNEKELSLMCAKGDSNAQKTLYDTYSGYLFGICLRYMANREDALDLLHDCFIKIYSQIDKFSYKGNGSLRAWLSKVTVNEAIGRIRKSNKLKFSDVPLSIIDGVVDDVPVQMQALSIPEIMNLIRQLPLGYRTVFNMYVIEEKSHKEIAHSLGINEKSSSSQLLRAKALLAKKINEYVKNRE